MESYQPIILANEPAFKVGSVVVTPATREVIYAGLAQSLEPRVMQVLVVLAQAQGAVVSREELVDRCWGGRIVGENAIDRVISRIRHLAASFGDSQFTLETITKVGYRLMRPGAMVASDMMPPVPSQHFGGAVTRRRVLGTAALVSGTALTWAWLRPPARYQPSREARILFENGKNAQSQLRYDQTQQSISFLRQAVSLDPDFADAWGALAISYSNLAEFAQDAEQEALAARTVSAARRALDLDRRNADADVAIILTTPHFRNWAKVEQACRQGLIRHPEHVRLRGKIPRVMCDTGRWRKGAEGFEKLVKAEPFRIPLHNQLALALWSADRLDDAERVIEHAAALWPGHPAIQATRVDFMMFMGRPDAAAMSLALTSDERGVREGADLRRAVASALVTGSPVARSRTIAGLISGIESEVISVDRAVPMLAALGGVDAAFAALNDYFFDRPKVAAEPKIPLHHLSRRETDFLFWPPTALLRADRRFAELTAAIGLNDYWRSKRTVPDWQRR